jgi:hypothetical protein
MLENIGNVCILVQSPDRYSGYTRRIDTSTEHSDVLWIVTNIEGLSTTTCVFDIWVPKCEFGTT